MNPIPENDDLHHHFTRATIDDATHFDSQKFEFIDVNFTPRRNKYTFAAPNPEVSTLLSGKFSKALSPTFIKKHQADRTLTRLRKTLSTSQRYDEKR